MATRPIILAETNEELRHRRAEFLKANGYPVAQAKDGEIALVHLHKIERPHLIILEVMMPHLDGIETCMRIRKLHGPNDICPIIFLTVMDTPQILLDCLRAGGDDVVMKNGSLAKFAQRVQFWSRRSAFADLGARRRRAISELELAQAPQA